MDLYFNNLPTHFSQRNSENEVADLEDTMSTELKLLFLEPGAIGIVRPYAVFSHTARRHI